MDATQAAPRTAPRFLVYWQQTGNQLFAFTACVQAPSPLGREGARPCPARAKRDSGTSAATATARSSLMRRCRPARSGWPPRRRSRPLWSCLASRFHAPGSGAGRFRESPKRGGGGDAATSAAPAFEGHSGEAPARVRDVGRTGARG